jgi:hypothetical protein
MSTPTDRLVRRYWVAMVSAVNQYEEQKQRFEDVRAAYRDRHADLTTARLKASGDPRSGDATALGMWFRDEALMYAAVISALRADEAATSAAHIPAQVTR